MKSIVFESTGEPAAVLKVTDAEPPEVGPGQVLVKMIASPVNPSDLMFVRGQYTLPAEPPATPGFEGVGLVVQAGGGLRSKMLAGKRVAVLSRRGGNWADFNVLPASQAIPFSPLLTGALTTEQQATFFVNPVTAWVMTMHVLKVPAESWLLLTAAGSVLGRMIQRIARRQGFRTLCVVRRQEQATELEQAGADAAVWFDPGHHDPRDLVDVVRQITNQQGVASAIDCVGGPTGSAVVKCLARGGRMLVYGTLSGQPMTLSPRDLMTPGTSVEGFWLGNYMEKLGMPARLKLVRKVAGLIREGVLDSDIGQQYSLDEITSAVQAAEQPGHGGKVLLRISDG